MLFKKICQITSIISYEGIDIEQDIFFGGHQVFVYVIRCKQSRSASKCK